MMNATAKKTDAPNQIKTLAALFKILADENRLQILACLADGEKCVCQLTEAVHIPQNLMSHHLRVLREHDLISDEKRGRWVYYSLKAPELKELLSGIEKFCDCSANKQCP